MHIRSVKESDLDQIKQMNEEVVPHVNSVSISEFKVFMRIASFFLVIEQAGNVAGFIIVIGPGQVYESLNYQYFGNKYSSFNYIDRIVIDKDYRGRGFGKAFYDFLKKHSTQTRLCCEVNIKPPNPDSVNFHQAMGFKEVDQQETEGGKKRVSLMVVEREDY